MFGKRVMAWLVVMALLQSGCLNRNSGSLDNEDGNIVFIKESLQKIIDASEDGDASRTFLAGSSGL
jgi:hypothetical protein